MTDRSANYQQCGFNIEPYQDAGTIFLTVPEDVNAGDRVAVHASRKALERLQREIQMCLDGTPCRDRTSTP